MLSIVFSVTRLGTASNALREPNYISSTRTPPSASLEDLSNASLSLFFEKFSSIKETIFFSMFFFLEDSIKCRSSQTVTDEEFQSIRMYYEDIKSCTHDNNIILTTANGTIVFTFPGFIEFDTMIELVPSLSSICDQMTSSSIRILCMSSMKITPNEDMPSDLRMALYKKQIEMKHVNQKFFKRERQLLFMDKSSDTLKTFLTDKIITNGLKS